MNKQLINKYKLEFDHWLNEGSVLIKSDLGWCPIATEFTWSCNISVNVLFVINDEYVELRKALVEGKIIQINNSKPETWIDIDADKLANYNPSFLRIKPDEPKFKVGDWVVEIHSTTEAQVLELFGDQIRIKFCYPDAIITTDSSDFIPWVPKEGEWCWFYDSKSGKSSHLAKFKQMSRQFFESEEIGIYDYCEPFLNSLPSYLKDK